MKILEEVEKERDAFIKENLQGVPFQYRKKMIKFYFNSIRAGLPEYGEITYLRPTFLKVVERLRNEVEVNPSVRFLYLKGKDIKTKKSSIKENGLYVYNPFFDCYEEIG